MARYDTIGTGYSKFRKPDPRIASAIDAALGDAASVVNIGAGAGSYESSNREVIAIEPSEVMIRQRPAGAALCHQAFAEALPLQNRSVDAAMAILSIHHWTDVQRGLLEMKRVARKRVLLLTWVPDAEPFWLTQDYFPEIIAHDREVFPTSAALSDLLQRLIGRVRFIPVPVPHDCIDGMLCAYWRRPEAYLNADTRSAISSFSRIDAEPGLARLHDDLSSGRWLERHRSLLELESLDLGYRIACCELDRKH